MGGLASRWLSRASAVRRALTPLLAVAACALVTGLAQAYGLIGLDPELKGFPLQAAEFSRLDVRAGWLEGAPDRMVFEIRNPLAAPVNCASVQVDLRDRGPVVRSLEPAVWVPANQTRRTSASLLRKADVRNFSLVCTCLRRGPKGACEAPLKP
jgi:hypothetical protein